MWGIIPKKKRIYKVLRIVMLCIIAIAISAAALYFAVTGVVHLVMRPEKSFDKEIKAIACESEEIPYISSYGSLYKDKEIASVFEVCEKQDKSYENMLCIYNNSVYFVCTEQQDWYIASVDLETLDFRVHCSLENPADIYDRHPIPGDFKKLNGYYYDGKLILNDFVTVLEYDLVSQTVTQYAYHEYAFPEIKVFGSWVDDETVKIHTERGEKTFTLNEISQKSPGMSAIYAFKERLNWDDKPYITHFFDERSVQYVDGKIYVIGEVRNYHGQAYAVIMQYDESKDSWKYVTGIYTNDNEYCYILPEHK